MTKFLPDTQLQSITGQIFLGHAILVAYELGIFKLITNQSLSIQALSSLTGVHERAIQAIISCAGALDLIVAEEDKYQLSPLGNMYLDAASPEYYGKVLDLLIQEHEIMTYQNIKKIIVSNKSCINPDGALFANSDKLSNTQQFIDALHQKAFKPAFYWAKMLDLKKYKTFIDIGGGSGIHTIAACLNNPTLQGIVCDRKAVLPFTQKYIEDFNLENRVTTCAIDMWNDPLPTGEICFLGDIFHDWDMDKCIYLAKKCYQSLSKNGEIVLHEMLFNTTKMGPLLTAAYNMKMLAWTEGQQYSVVEIEQILHKAGFCDIHIHKSLGNWSIITGTK